MTRKITDPASTSTTTDTTDLPGVIVEAARIAATIDAPEFTAGILAKLDAAGLPQLADPFLHLVLEAGCAAIGITFAELLALEVAAR